MVKTDIDWMREALEESKLGRHIAPPNPAVGCVIVRDGKLLSRGHTQRPGGHHAEIEAIEALKAQGLDARGATAYVTLEPCSHFGRTPPCATRLVEEGVSRVVVATADPNPLVAGRGIAILRDAGITVDVGVAEDEAIESNKGFICRMKTGKPWVRLKVAASLDGRTALTNGQSQWITGEEARADARRLRADAQGLLTGIGTVLADNPRMDARVEGLPDPVRFIVDVQARTPASARILAGGKAVLFVTAKAPLERVEALRKADAEVVQVPSDSQGRCDLEAVLKSIGERGVNELHVEAGATLNGALLQAGLVDEVVFYLAPALLGEGWPLAELGPYASMEEVRRFAWHDMQRVGDDIRLTLRSGN